MSKKIEKILRDDYDKIQMACLKQFDNEGADIGDACDAGELFGNAMGWHSTHTYHSLIEFVATLIDAPFNDVRHVADKMIDQYYK